MASAFWLDRMHRVIDKMLRDALREATRHPSALEVDRAATSIAELMSIADLQGRLGVREQVGLGLTGKRQPGRFSRPPEDRMPPIRLDEMLSDIRKRSPEFAPTAEAVADLYRSGDGFAAARIASREVAMRVQKYIVESREQGVEPQDAIRQLQRAGSDGALKPWSRAYAENVYRTNIATSMVGGMLQEAKDPAYQRVLPAWRYRTAEDRDVRDGRNSLENHAALDGMTRAVDWDGWVMWLPPGGYQCRCTIIPVSAPELRRSRLMGRDGSLSDALYDPQPPKARFHPNFQPKSYARI